MYNFYHDRSNGLKVYYGPTNKPTTNKNFTQTDQKKTKVWYVQYMTPTQTPSNYISFFEIKDILYTD